MFLTRGGPADGGVFRAELEALHTETVEAALCVVAALGAAMGAALIYVHTRLPIVLQTEARLTSTLQGETWNRAGKALW